MTATHHTTQHDTPRNTTRQQVRLYQLGHHLSIAREEYLKHAQVMDSAGPAYHPVRDTFLSMAEECGVLANACQYEDVQGVRLVGDTLVFTWKEWEEQ